MEEPGISLDDLPGVYREEFLYGVEIARAQHDPCVEWEAFTEALWGYLVRAFGLDVVATADRVEEHTGPDADVR